MKLVNAPRFGTGICLSRVEYLLSALEIDKEWLSRTGISITGSNGKGSSALTLSRIAQAHGLKTGLFTSPHLYQFSERFQIDGSEVDDTEVQLSLSRIYQFVSKYESEFSGEKFGAFELLFAVAVDLFFRRSCELCVFEAGIGGRYDPVRLVKSKVAVVTSLDLEHTALLGSTMEQICLDKTDICLSGGIVFYGVTCAPYRRTIEAYCELNGLLPVILEDSKSFEVISVGLKGTEFAMDVSGKDGTRFISPLIGEHQANNSVLSLLAFEAWCRQVSSIKFSSELAQKGLAEVRWPGRLELIDQSPLTVIDVGHSPGGVSAAVSGLKKGFPGVSFVLVTGVSADKDARGILEVLATGFDTIICTQAYHNGTNASDIAQLVHEVNALAQLYLAPTIGEAVVISKTVAAEKNYGIYVAGGMYLAAEYAHSWRGGATQLLPHLF